jgi:hypothetical protein
MSVKKIYSEGIMQFDSIIGYNDEVKRIEKTYADTIYQILGNEETKKIVCTNINKESNK